MQIYSVEILPNAQIDLDDIWDEVAVVDFNRADQFVAKIETRISSLAQLPDRGFNRSDLFPNTRVLIEGNYLIFYQVKEVRVIVMRVVHGARELSELNFT
jgi:toxin ParE1/3/4